MLNGKSKSRAIACSRGGHAGDRPRLVLIVHLLTVRVNRCAESIGDDFIGDGHRFFTKQPVPVPNYGRRDPASDSGPAD